MKAITENKSPLDAVTERTGGRSAIVREAVLKAARQLLMERGVDALTHRNIAQLANVNASTVYRRWPDKTRLLADVFKNTADSMVTLPNTGSLEEDLLQFLSMISSMLASPEGRKLAHGSISAVSSDDEMVKSSIRWLWEQRFQQAECLFDQAVFRGENGYEVKRREILEALIAPIWFRILVTQHPVQEQYLIEKIKITLEKSGY